MLSKDEILEKIELLGDSFEEVLYAENKTFMNHIRKNNRGGDDPRKYMFWGWIQGVGLYGFWKIYEQTGNEKYLNILTKYYEKTFEIGLPSKNVNTVAPMLPLAFLYEHTKNEIYLEKIKEWSDWIYNDLTRTREGGFQHIVSATENKGELWDDTLFMTVLFLTKAGLLLSKREYIEEAKYQFLIHIKYLTDKKTGLWFHGWTFEGDHNFVEALWGRGNGWVTIAIPEFIQMLELDRHDAVYRFLNEALLRQVEELKKHQSESGLWHTLIDDPTSYVEASGTAGFAAGIVKAVKMGILPEDYLPLAEKALQALVDCIDEKGHVQQVSRGTSIGRDSKDYYKSIELKSLPYGQALVMLVLIEFLKES